MPKAMSPEDWKARGQAYTEAAQHLLQSWTEERREWEQGNIVRVLLDREAQKCFRIAETASQPVRRVAGE